MTFLSESPCVVQELALQCMAYEPQARPTFQQIEDRLSQLQATVQPTSEKAFLRASSAAAAAAAAETA